MRQPLFVLAFLAAVASPTRALDEPSVRIRGKGASTLYICDDKPYLNCWYARPYNYCTFPRSTNYKINKNKIIIEGSVAKIIYYLTKNCYDKEPEHAQHLRYYYGNKGVSCSHMFGQFRCALDIDEYSSRIYF
jgi:hypothetical protein